jgi:hypothetical protein
VTDGTAVYSEPPEKALRATMRPPVVASVAEAEADEPPVKLTEGVVMKF